jgi:hypothetical protein
MSSRFRAFVAAVIGLLVSAQVVFGHYQDWPPTSWTLAREVTTWRTAGDSMYARATMTWSVAATAGMRHMATHGNRFTHDVHDLDGNLSATGRWSTQLPNPYYDRDSSGGIYPKYAEAEITSEYSLFPQAGLSYTSRIEFSHWFWYCPPRLACKWAWDPNGGNLAQTAQISRQLCPWPCDKWDADPDLQDRFMGNTSYPYLAQTSASTSFEPEPTAAFAPLSGDRLETPYMLVEQNEPGEVRIAPDLSSGIDQYRVQAHALADAVAAAGPSVGVITFARPVQDTDLSDLRAMGITIYSVEAVTAPDDGLRWTYGAPYASGVVDALSQAATSESRTLVGVIAATVQLPSAREFRAAVADERVFLVDVAQEHARRNHPELTDVEQNDLYWILAGWA